MCKRVIASVLAVAADGCGVSGVLAPYKQGTSGAEYCSRLAMAASGKADSDFRWGSAFGIAGVGAAGTASVMAATIHNPTFGDRFVEGVLPISATILVVVSE